MSESLILDMPQGGSGKLLLKKKIIFLLSAVISVNHLA